MSTDRLAAHVVESISDYISFLEESFQEVDDVLFRGQQEDWPLVPKLSRIILRGDCDLLSTEQAMLNDFKRQALSFFDFVPDNDWDWLSLAQHYGMATRLLDWTTNPLAALWFAIEQPAREKCPKNKPKEPAVVWTFDASPNDYVSDTSKGDPFSGVRTKVFRPRHIASRIRAQSGWFTVHKFMPNNRRAFIPLNSQSRYKKALMKIVIPPDKFSPIRYELDRCGLNGASMLTDLAGLCRHIEWQHSLLEDEVD